MAMRWVFDQDPVNWDELASLYHRASLGDKEPGNLKVVFSHSMFKCFVFENGMLVGAGRALADGADCAYLCDVVVHPDCQSRGLGSAIITRLKELSSGHNKIILYARPGTEGLYQKLGFRRMRTAMAIFRNQERAARVGLVDQT